MAEYLSVGYCSCNERSGSYLLIIVVFFVVLHGYSVISLIFFYTDTLSQITGFYKYGGRDNL